MFKLFFRQGGHQHFAERGTVKGFALADLRVEAEAVELFGAL